MSFAALSIADMTILSIPPDNPDKIRHDWTTAEAREIIAAPLNDLVHAAQTSHRNHFDANEIQVSTLLSIKTGGCPEDCSYCSQSAHNEADVGADKLMSLDAVRAPPYGRRIPAQPGSAWAPPGGDQRTATSTPFAT